MYGTIAKIKVKPGALDQLRELSEQWWTERKPDPRGTQGLLLSTR